MKYIITLSRKGRKRAVTTNFDSLDKAKKTVESMMKVNKWTDAELFANDCITPAMDDGYLLLSSAAKNGREVKWNDSNLKPI